MKLEHSYSIRLERQEGTLAGLGVVELTISLLKVFDPQKDKIIWDVGHQSYPYKILTGRKDFMHLLRKPDGIAPFQICKRVDMTILELATRRPL